uniref:cytochrome c oxidase subunit II n=1 Tax=Halistemma rubrum TaxID=316183 RepID=UPI0026E1E812|nr:cytochrome c oxidase subunit II [Halistemma rubrum]WJJ70209.1 cytochrome c oxidase subunit 2 [Halistemma rubrum]WJJ70233.1 cytochrome c oxidase subunit 2 [Halistemma rubrum]
MNKFLNFIYWDGPEFSDLSFPDVATPTGEALKLFHDEVMFIVVFMTILVAQLLWGAITNLSYNKFLIHGTSIEVIWTIIPAFILLMIATPSMNVLYAMEEVTDPIITIKAVGHQWYWSYSYEDMEDVAIEFDSYMVNSTDLTIGDIRLLEVDNRLVLPTNSEIRVIITGADVIHCFAVPSLGIKADAIPGRLNQTKFFLKRAGVYYGQCSEICGSDHSFMPIVVEGVPMKDFIKWIIDQKEDE